MSNKTKRSVLSPTTEVGESMVYPFSEEEYRRVLRCPSMILGWDFYWFGVGRGCDVFLWGGRVLKGRSWGRVDVLVCYGCVA